MNKIIDGKRYDTETAKKLADWDNGLGRSDFGYIEEELYRTKSGNYFLLGEGGVRTKYAESCGNNSWQGGTRIIPLTETAAREWCEEHLDADEYEAVFGRLEEESVILGLNVPESLRDRFTAIRESEGVTSAALLEAMIAKYGS